jgi:hypothetical protein
MSLSRVGRPDASGVARDRLHDGIARAVPDPAPLNLRENFGARRGTGEARFAAKRALHSRGEAAFGDARFS